MRCWSNLAAKAHLFAKNLEILPLSLTPALAMKVELYRWPNFGVEPFFLRALNKAFSAPIIWIVEAGSFAKLDKLPDAFTNLAPSFNYKSKNLQFRSKELLDLVIQVPSFLLDILVDFFWNHNGQLHIDWIASMKLRHIRLNHFRRIFD